MGTVKGHHDELFLLPGGKVPYFHEDVVGSRYGAAVSDGPSSTQLQCRRYHRGLCLTDSVYAGYLAHGRLAVPVKQCQQVGGDFADPPFPATAGKQDHQQFQIGQGDGPFVLQLLPGSVLGRKLRDGKCGVDVFFVSHTNNNRKMTFFPKAVPLKGGFCVYFRRE